MLRGTTPSQPADVHVPMSPPIVYPPPQENTTLLRTSTRVKKQPAKFNDYDMSYCKTKTIVATKDIITH